jgi:hypothetical protein
VAPGKPGQSVTGDGARRLHHGRERHCHDSCRSFPVPIRPAVRRLAGHDAAAEIRAAARNAWGVTSKRGDKYIRSLLIAGGVAVLRHARNRPTRDGEWVRALLARKPLQRALTI